MIHHLQHIADLVKIFELKGVQHVVISPGSRNAPLIGLFYNSGNFQLHSIVDERSAAFYGLGIALATGQAVALLCTSGTAVLNYAPALAEAYYQRIPLIAITADRPENLIDQQDNQTIRQAGVYHNYIKDSIHLHLPVHDVYELQTQHYGINKVINAALSGIRGPVHINVPIAEPLYVESPVASQHIATSAPDEINEENVDELIKAWKRSEKPMILCGEGSPGPLLNSILQLLSEKAVVLAEPIANTKGGNIIHEIDRLMIQAEKIEDADFFPDLLISYGGPVVSKRLKIWLQKQKALEHYRMAEEIDHIDTYQNLKGQSIGLPEKVFSAIVNSESDVNQHYLSKWRVLHAKNTEVHNQVLHKLPYSDLKVFHAISQQLPAGTILHLGNSSPVRYAQMFDLSRSSRVFSNRGVSGIDGCLSTAAGFASQTSALNLAILGDLSFVYDSNALWNNKLTDNLKIVVINNEGGGIFRLLPGPSRMDAFKEFMETKHPVDLEKLVRAFGVKYAVCRNESELDTKLKHFFQSKTGPSLLEIKTPGIENAEVYKRYIKMIK